MSILHGKTVLLVEDEYIIALDGEQILRDLGANRVEIASSLAAAQLKAAASHFDLAVLDVNLNGETSFPVGRAMAARGTAVVFASGYDLKQRSTEVGGAVVVSKPYSEDRLRTAVTAALAAAKAA